MRQAIAPSGLKTLVLSPVIHNIVPDKLAMVARQGTTLMSLLPRTVCVTRVSYPASRIFQNILGDLKTEASVGQEKTCNLTNVRGNLRWEYRKCRGERTQRGWCWLRACKRKKPVHLLLHGIEAVQMEASCTSSLPSKFLMHWNILAASIWEKNLLSVACW